MNFKLIKGVLRRKNIDPYYYVHCCVIGFHGSSLLHFRCEGFFSGGGILKQRYLNDHAEFDCTIPYITLFMIIFWPVQYLR